MDLPDQPEPVDTPKPDLRHWIDSNTTGNALTAAEELNVFLGQTGQVVYDPDIFIEAMQYAQRRLQPLQALYQALSYDAQEILSPGVFCADEHAPRVLNNVTERIATRLELTPVPIIIAATLRQCTEDQLRSRLAEHAAALYVWTWAVFAFLYDSRKAAMQRALVRAESQAAQQQTAHPPVRNELQMLIRASTYIHGRPDSAADRLTHRITLGSLNGDRFSMWAGRGHVGGEKGANPGGESPARARLSWIPDNSEGVLGDDEDPFRCIEWPHDVESTQ